MMDNSNIIVFTICFTVALCSICEEGWRFSPHSRKCYKYFPRAMTWTEGEFHCLMQAGHQLSVHSWQENKFVKEIARSGTEVWLGCAKFGKNSECEWSDKTSLNFRGWKNDKEPVIKFIRPCTKMNVTNGEWFQSCCRKVAPYICQKDPKPNTSGRENSHDTTGRNPTLNERLRFLLRK